MGISQLQYTDSNSPRNIFIVGVGLYLVRGPCFEALNARTRALQSFVSCCTATASCLSEQAVHWLALPVLQRAPMTVLNVPRPRKSSGMHVIQLLVSNTALVLSHDALKAAAHILFSVASG